MGQERGMTMDQEKMMLLKKYDHVWQRVMPDADPYAVPAEERPSLGERKGETPAKERIEQKIAAELADRDYYLTLARRGGAGSRVFQEMAADEERHARRLKAVWFLALGQRMEDCGPVTVFVPQKKVEALRQRYGEECRSAEEYFAMAESAHGCIAEMLRAMGRDEQRHAESLLRILERMM